MEETTHNAAAKQARGDRVLRNTLGGEKGELVPLTPETLNALRGVLRPAVDAAEAENDGQHVREGAGWSGYLTGNVPVQGYGVIDEDLNWYFRARYDEWSFGVGTDEDSAIDGELFEVSAAYGEPDGFAAGWMPYREAWEFIEQAIAAYRSR